MAAGENPGAGSPREPYQQLVRTIVAEISDRLPLEAFYSVVIAHEGKTFVAAMVQLEGQPPQTATIDYEDEHRTLFYEVFWQEVALTGQGGPTQLYAASFAPKSNSFVYHGSHPYDPAEGMPDAAALQRFAQRELQNLLGARSERDVTGRSLLALADNLLNLLTDGTQRNIQRLEGLRGHPVAFVD